MVRTITRPDGEVTLDLAPEETLLGAVRGLGLRSASRGCEDGRCGACRVLVDGAIVHACVTLWRDVPERARIEAAEDLTLDPAAARAVEAFSSERPTRCRMCVGALAVTAAAIARAGKSGDAEAIREAIGEATCMCTGRGSWRRALLP